jgi:type I restriction enzyme S subunit
LSDCVDVLDNLRVPVNSDERSQRQGKIPYYGATGQVGWIDDYLFDEELLLIGEDGAPFFDKSKPIAYIINSKSWVNNHAHVLRAKVSVTSNTYLKHFLNHFDFHEYVNGTTRLKLTQGAMNKIPVLLPPHTEQRRIVAKLEMLLSKVDTYQQRFVKIPVVLKRFRRAVLEAACSGGLTVDRLSREDIGKKKRAI